MKIGTLSASTGVNIETIRYYEKIGLLSKPDRTNSGRRVYDTDAAQRLSLIRHARALGFGIPAIKAMIEPQGAAQSSCRPISEVAKVQLQNVETGIRELQRRRRELQKMIAECSNGNVAECQIIGNLVRG